MTFVRDIDNSPSIKYYNYILTYLQRLNHLINMCIRTFWQFLPKTTRINRAGTRTGAEAHRYRFPLSKEEPMKKHHGAKREL